MAIVDIHWRPSPKELRVFAGLQMLFFGIVAWVISSRFQAPVTATVILGAAVAVGVLGLCLPKLIWPVYVVWMSATWPLAWLISLLVLAIVFYLLITPIGLVVRVWGRDPMERRFDARARTYWKKRDSASETRRYFRQY